MNTDELEHRILSLLDGDLAAEEVTELEAVLREDADARETFRILVNLHNSLEARYRFDPGQLSHNVVPIHRIMARQRQRMVKSALIAAAAVILIATVLMKFVLAPEQPVHVGTLDSAPGSIYSLASEVDGEGPERGKLTIGSRIVLSKGVIEGTFESGASFLAEAPCDLRVLDRGFVGLTEGVVRFRVPPKAKGFRIETPEMTVVDLGTEFGVVSSRIDPDEIHVFVGSVEVAPKGKPVQKQILKAGEARRVSADEEMREIRPDPPRFRLSLDEMRAIAISNHSFEADILPRDGNTATKQTGEDDYNVDVIPSGWLGFDDGDGGTEGSRGVLSTAPDSYFSSSLAATPDADPNDQTFYSAARDIYQVLGEPLLPNSSYTLSVDIGDRKAEGGEGSPGNPGIRLGVGGKPGEHILKPASVHFPSQTDGEWVTWTATYVTGSDVGKDGEPLRIELTSGSQVGWFDNVRLSVTSKGDLPN